MKNYAYVRASSPVADRSLIGFDHTFITADDDSDAYTVGQHWANSNPLGAGFIFLNDYACKAWLRDRDDEVTLADKLAVCASIAFVALFWWLVTL